MNGKATKTRPIFDKLPVRVAGRRDLDFVDKIVYAFLLNSAARNRGMCWPSLDEIGEKTGNSARTVDRAVSRLRAAKDASGFLIERRKEIKADHRRNSIFVPAWNVRNETYIPILRRLSGLKCGPRLLFGAVYSAGRNTVCAIKMDTLAARLGCSTSSAKRWSKELQRAGLLTVTLRRETCQPSAFKLVGRDSLQTQPIANDIQAMKVRRDSPVRPAGGEGLAREVAEIEDYFHSCLRRLHPNLPVPLMPTGAEHRKWRELVRTHGWAGVSDVIEYVFDNWIEVREHVGGEAPSVHLLHKCWFVLWDKARGAKVKAARLAGEVRPGQMHHPARLASAS